MQAQTKIAVAGATGRAGRHTVDVLTERGYDVVRISRTDGVDLISGDGLEEALSGVEVVIDAATSESPDEATATEFFETATRNLQEAGRRAGVKRIVVVSIIGADRFASGYSAAKVAHERAALAGPIPAQILRAAQFHELVELLVTWGRDGDVARVPRMRTQPVAARTVAEALADLATDRTGATPIAELAGPREESLPELARMLVGDELRIEAVSDPDHREVYEGGGLLPGPGATLAGPTFEEWLKAR